MERRVKRERIHILSDGPTGEDIDDRGFTGEPHRLDSGAADMHRHKIIVRLHRIAAVAEKEQYFTI